MRRPLLGILMGILTCVLAATVLQPAPASAESGQVAKEVGNAPAAIDITAVRADNAQRRVRMRLVVPGLTDRGTFTFSYESAGYDGMAIVVRKPRSGVVAQAWHCNEDSCAKVRCPGLSVRWRVAEHYVAASVPQACYPLKVPDVWNFNGHSDLGKDYDSEYAKLRLHRG